MKVISLQLEPTPLLGTWGWLCFDANTFAGDQFDTGMGLSKEDAISDFWEKQGVRP